MKCLCNFYIGIQKDALKMALRAVRSLFYNMAGGKITWPAV